MTWQARVGVVSACSLVGCSLLIDTSDLSGGALQVPDSGEGGVSTSTDASSLHDADGADLDGAGSSRYAAAVLADDPIMYWRLDDGAARSSNATALRGSPATYAAEGVQCGGAGAIAGDVGTSCSFDQSTGRLALAAGLPANAVSLEVWARPRAVDATVRFVASYSSPVTQADGLQLYFRDEFTIFSRTAGGETAYAGISSGPSAGTYHHFVGTFDGALVRLYMDGSERASASASGALSVSNGMLAFADSAVSQFYKLDGDLDEIAVYDKALPAARVLAHFEIGTGR